MRPLLDSAANEQRQITGNHMRALVASGVALAFLAISGAATAADLPMRGPSVGQPVPPYDWSGIFFGVSIGVGNGSSTHTAAAGDLTPRFDLTGGIFGLALGYNWEAGALVYGVDTDISLSTIKGNSAYLGAFPGFVAETSERWLATYRGRLGMKLANTWMAYVTGGGASSAVKVTATEPGAGIAWESQILSGWTVGAGIEAARIHSFTVKAEYLYVDFGNQGFFNPPPAGFFNRAGGVRLHDNIFRLGLNHKFQGF
ncbi:MAG: outer membrane beta-barrel protein [Xanthobacteraceae bacterium]|jgi:outer membrane immunogenic protein